MLNNALRCVERGWHIFPLRPNEKIPFSGSRGFKDASNSLETVKKWWTKNPDANIGIATGKVSGITVIDVDVKKGKKGKESAESIKGFLYKTFTVGTTTGGWHLYYRNTEPLGSKNDFMNGIDVKSDGGYVVAPGSKINDKNYGVMREADIPALSTSLRTMIARAILSKKPNIQVKKLDIKSYSNGKVSAQDIEVARAFALFRLVGMKPRTKIKCPWHSDDEPSLYLYSDGNGYCFPCEKQVDSIAYLRKTEGISFTNAVKYLIGANGT